MNKKKNNKVYNRYEVQEKTTKFVKEKLPAYVLAIIMVFWTIASVLGIIAYAKSKREDNQGVITASANAIDEFVMLRDFDIPLTPLSGYQNDNKYMYDTPYLLIRDRTVYLLNSFAYQSYLDGEESLDGYEMTASNGGLLGYPVITDQPAFNNEFDGLTFPLYCQSLTAFDLNTVFLYDYYSPYTLDTSIYYDFGDPTIRFDFTLKLAFYRVSDDYFNDPIIVGFYDYNFYVEIDVEMQYQDKSIFVLPRLDFYYEDDTVISDIGLFAIRLYSDYQSDAHNYYYMRTFRNEMYDYQYQVEELLSELDSLQVQYNRLVADYSELYERYEGANTVIVGMEIQIDELESEILDLKSQIVDLLQQNADSQALIGQLRNQINSAYAEGKQVGFDNGREIGRAEGVASANEYTFDGLLSAVFDVPVRVFRSLFNFEILGINLANFFLSLLTLAIIIFIVRWIL